MAQDYRPARIHVLAKPVGSICNLECSYCFFLDKELLYPSSTFRMSEEVLENYIQQLIAAHRTQQVTVAWQGGEPTLMGIEFYRRAIELQEKYKKPGMTFENTMQTNGTLLDDKWCRFFKENNFLVGISIDGPHELHDSYRVDKKGEGTFDRVMRGLRLLQKHSVEYNVLTTVNRINADYPLEVYRFMRDEVRIDWIQFIPVVERINEEGNTLYQKGDRVSDRSVLPEQFGNFLNIIFDEWIRNDVGKIFVQTFEASARRWLRMPSGMCVFEETCGIGLALEHNGDIYSCDHFVEPNYMLGNIMEKEIIELAGSERQYKFGQDKRDSLPKVCRECNVLFACRGECPKNRFLTTSTGEQGMNYLCDGLKAFFHHIDFPMQTLAELIRHGLPALEVMRVLVMEEAFVNAKRNDPCPCGSGKKFKSCHSKRKGMGQKKRNHITVQ
jgi:uncharacterized protein